MRVREERLFKVPIDEIRALLRSQYGVDLAGVEPYLDENHLVFALALDSEPGSSSGPALTAPQTVAQRKPIKARRRRKKRNRIRTRGWNVIGKITNSKGLVANIYEPLVKSLEGREITRSEQRKIVRQLLISNGNEPSEDSVDYFLDNALEFLAERAEGATTVHAN